MKHVSNILGVGFGTGVVLVFVATLGLAVGFVEFLKPVLAPGTEIVRLMLDAYGGTFGIPPLLFGIVLNGAIYAALFFIISVAHTRIADRALQWIAIALVLIGFLWATGMIATILDLFASPDPYWIFETGA